MNAYLQTYVCAITINKKEAKNLKESKEGCTGGLVGRERQEEMIWLYYNLQNNSHKTSKS